MVTEDEATAIIARAAHFIGEVPAFPCPIPHPARNKFPTEITQNPADAVLERRSVEHFEETHTLYVENENDWKPQEFVVTPIANDTMCVLGFSLAVLVAVGLDQFSFRCDHECVDDLHFHQSARNIPYDARLTLHLLSIYLEKVFLYLDDNCPLPLWEIFDLIHFHFTFRQIYHAQDSVFNSVMNTADLAKCLFETNVQYCEKYWL